MNAEEILCQIAEEYGRILGENLVGIYVHGSLAFGCFHWEKSDIDFLVVTKEAPTPTEKIELMETLLKLEPEGPQKGLEMSVVLEENCRNFVYPTPFELHFSKAHTESCKKDVKAYCQNMNGTDRDLAAHMTVIRAVGRVLCGKEIGEVFGAIPESAYMDSIQSDIAEAENDIIEDPVYVTLNLCRVLAYRREHLVLSKEQGGAWGIRNLPDCYLPVIRSALNTYSRGEGFSCDEKTRKAFAEYMRKQIFEM